ncbi:hypothetical protein ACFLQ4_01835 [Bacteroidota bacterium]
MKQLKNHILQFLVLLVTICLTHCASSTDTQSDYSGFLTFYSDGNEYTLMTYSSDDATGYNILMREENDNVIIKSIDKQQDGELDEILEGDISLVDANKIYSEALAIADEKGMLKKKSFQRYYNYSDRIYDYEIRTYLLVKGDNYNLFAAKKKIGSEITIIVDDKADGLLDSFQQGNGDILKFQALYEEVLRQGMINHRVVNADNIYLVTN